VDLRAALESPQWPREVGDHLARLVRHGPDSAELRLAPPDLGEIRVRVEGADAITRITLAVAQPHVREAITQALPDLRATLAAAGVSVGELNVTAQGQHPPSAGGQDAHPPPARARADAHPERHDAGDPVDTTGMNGRRHARLVDVFA
jgi:flagellar hook-length control protein FliK